jgi:hypothetical protein
MTRERLQNLVLFACVAALLLGLARIYQTFQHKMPLNLEGHIVVEGSMTANPPAQ